MPRTGLTRRSPAGGGSRIVVLVAAGLLALLGPAPAGLSSGAAPRALGAPIPVGLDGGFLGNLTGPSLVSGASGTLSFSVSDPLSEPLGNLSLVLAIYGFASGLSTPATSPSPAGLGLCPAGCPSGPDGSATLSLAALAPSGSERGAVDVVSGGGASPGTYLVETALSFTAGGSEYRFESRHHFSNATWTAATLPNGPDGAPGLNLTVLGVDGVTPETSISVTAPDAGLPIYALAGAGIVLVAVGAYVVWRRGPGSSEGTVAGADPQSAPSAIGKNRTSDGERSSS